MTERHQLRYLTLEQYAELQKAFRKERRETDAVEGFIVNVDGYLALVRDIHEAGAGNIDNAVIQHHESRRGRKEKTDEWAKLESVKEAAGQLVKALEALAGNETASALLAHQFETFQILADGTIEPSDDPVGDAKRTAAAVADRAARTLEAHKHQGDAYGPYKRDYDRARTFAVAKALRSTWPDQPVTPAILGRLLCIVMPDHADARKLARNLIKTEGQALGHSLPLTTRPVRRAKH